MHLPALQNQHGGCVRTEEEKQNCFSFYRFLFYALPLKIISLELSKMQFNVQGVTHNPVAQIENIDSRIV